MLCRFLGPFQPQVKCRAEYVLERLTLQNAGKKGVFLGPGKLLEVPLGTHGLVLCLEGGARHKLDRAARLGVFGSLAGVVRRHARLHVGRVSGIEGAVGTFDHIHAVHETTPIPCRTHAHPVHRTLR